ncbi:MAG: signal recognition particle receptor subunit alpha [Lachnospiraceae bacterium]
MYLRTFSGKGRLTEADVKAALKEVKLALLEADVSFKVVKQFIKAVGGELSVRMLMDEPDSGTDGDQDRKRRDGQSDGQRDARRSNFVLPMRLR